MPALQRRFGRLVASYRRQRKLTQAQLAEETGQSKDMIAKIEAGRTGVSFENIERIARALDLDPAALFSAAVSPGRFKDGPKRRILDRLSLLTDDDLAWVEDLLEAALKPRRQEAPLDRSRIKTMVRPKGRRSTVK
jgi:transcriptional regulator with XRE-family HTH domain